MDESTNIGMLGLLESDSDDNEKAIITQLNRPRHSSTPFNSSTINTEYSSLINYPIVSDIGMKIMIDKKLWNQRMQNKSSAKNQQPKITYKNRE